MRADRRAQSADGILPTLLGSSVVLLLVGLLRLTLDPYPYQVPLTASLLGVGAGVAGLRLACLHRDVRAWVRRRADGVCLSLCLVASLPFFVESLVLSIPAVGGGLMVFLLATGTILRVRRYSAVVTAVCLCQWLAVAVPAGLRGEWVPVTVLVCCAAVLARLVNRIRCRAVDSLAAAEVAILEAAVTDDLTGLSNRRGLLAAGRALLLRAGPQQPLACLYLDVDGLKTTNDRHGHEAGDRLLRDTAAGLAATTRPGDVVARLGGDEFALLLPGATPAAAAAVRDRLLTALSGTGVAASVGLACTDGTASIEQLLDEADTAMYAVKQHRRGHGRLPDRDRAPRAVLPQQARRELRGPVVSTSPWTDPTTATTTDVRDLTHAGAWLHLAVAPTHLLVLPDARGQVMAAVSLLVAVALGTIHRAGDATRLREWSRTRPDLLPCTVLVLVAAETITYGFVVSEPWAALTFVLPVVAAGGVLLSRLQASVVCLVTVAGWVSLALEQGAAATWAWSGVSLLGALGVATMLQVTHRRTVDRLTAAQAQVRAAALTDELTSLPNRRGFLAHGRPTVELSLRRGEQASVLFLDLDGLKQINDEHGHAAGDRLLTTAAEVLRSAQGPGDLCARLGGDEFTVLLHGCPAHEVPERVAWLERTLAEHDVSASIGTANAPRDATTLDALVDHADRAMLVVKQRRRERRPAAPSGRRAGVPRQSPSVPRCALPAAVPGCGPAPADPGQQAPDEHRRVSGT